MSRAIRPLATFQRPIIGRAVLVEIGTEVDVIAKSTDQITGEPFYIVRGDRIPFGVWASELADLRYCQPVGA